MGDRRLFALSDPHLSLTADKPMDVFGPRWENHVEHLRRNWLETVGGGDIVLVPGDISWGMRLGDARADLEWLCALPGEKVLLRGNHDYWWQSISKMEALGLPGLHFLQNNCVRFGELAVAGTRLWDFPGIHWRFVSNDSRPPYSALEGDGGRGEDDEKIRSRELNRLVLSLEKMPDDASLRVAMTHFPPLGDDGSATHITDILNKYGVDICVFGHVHALPDGEAAGADVVVGGTRFVLAASDYLWHKPKYLCTLQ